MTHEHRPDAALPVLEKAVAVAHRNQIQAGPASNARWALAQTLFALHRDENRARLLAIEARSLNPSPDMVHEIDQALAQRAR